MTWIQGKSGNENGRPPGIADKRTELRKLLDPHAKALIDKVVEMALSGDATAIRICIERLIPRIKSEAIEFSVAGIELDKVQSLVKLSAELIRTVANGDLTAEHAQQVTSLIECQRKLIETSDLDARISEIERALQLRNKMETKNA